MSEPEEGDRVGVIIGSRDKVVRFAGWGMFIGWRVPPHRGEKSMATLLHKAGATNPEIRLDGGKLAYGAECWWGSADEIQRRLERWRAEGWEILDVDIDVELGIGGPE